VAGRSDRTYPGGRKAATAVQIRSLFPIVTFSEGIKAAFSSSQPTGILPGMVKSWLPLGSGTSSEEWGRTMLSPDLPAIFR